MRKFLIAAALVAVVPAAAQAATAKVNPTEDLNCAIWAANVSGNSEDPEITNGFGLIMTWFIGRWEGATGRKFEEGMTPEYIVSITPRLDQIGEQCITRMVDFGDRMSAWGSKLEKAGQ